MARHYWKPSCFRMYWMEMVVRTVSTIRRTVQYGHHRLFVSFFLCFGWISVVRVLAVLEHTIQMANKHKETASGWQRSPRLADRWCWNCVRLDLLFFVNRVLIYPFNFHSYFHRQLVILLCVLVFSSIYHNHLNWTMRTIVVIQHKYFGLERHITEIPNNRHLTLFFLFLAI